MCEANGRNGNILILEAKLGSKKQKRKNSIRFLSQDAITWFGILKNSRVGKTKKAVISILGRLGVVLFFVLSGFLISYLLFVEKKVTKTISVKKFYIRRILRIWPLYFLIILLALSKKLGK